MKLAIVIDDVEIETIEVEDNYDLTENLKSIADDFGKGAYNDDLPEALRSE